MPESTTGRFADSADFESSLSDLAIELVITEPGNFHAQLTSVTLANLRLFRVRETLARVAYITLPAASICVSFAARGGPPLIWNGIELGPQGLVFHSRRERLHQRTSGPSHWGLVAIAPAFFARHGGALAGYKLGAPTVGRIVRPSSKEMARLLGLHARVARLVETRPSAIGHAGVDRALEDEVLYALVTCLDDPDAYDGPNADRRCRHIMGQLEEVLTIDPEHRLRVRDVCTMIGVPEQTLGACCNAFLGMSPDRYLLLRRLKRARAAMRRQDPTAVRVGDIARDHGFSKAGRFAAAYRTAFGENPSVTLARLRHLGR